MYKRQAQDSDSFITHRNMRENFERIRKSGLSAYQAELDEKVAILEELLEQYNDGRKKSFFCLAVNFCLLYTSMCPSLQSFAGWWTKKVMTPLCRR